MFAGPNGSGKSTLKTVLPQELLGVYLNADEIEADVNQTGILDVRAYQVIPDTDVDRRICQFFRNSTLIRTAGLENAAMQIQALNGVFDFSQVPMNSYFASVAADFLRQHLLKQQTSFTMETVMSSIDKVELLAKAKQIGYRTYLYYIATDDPEINKSRVRNRVLQGGHAVPEDKIVSRYHRSLSLLMPAIRHADRAYIFDNSGHNTERTWLAEITDGHTLEIKTDQIPEWFKSAVLRYFISDASLP